MAIAERKLADEFGSDLVDHYTYVLAGDGCLMEGISQEALSLAGHLKLDKLIVFWDDNGISIDGKVSLSDSTDQQARFEALGLGNALGRRPRPGRHRDRGRAGALVRPPDADRLPHHHRLRRPDPRRHLQGARFAARRRGNRGRPQGARLGVRALRYPVRNPRRLAPRRPERRQGTCRLGKTPRRGRCDASRRIRAPHARRPSGLLRLDHGDLAQAARRRPAQCRDPQVVGNDPRGRQRRRHRDAPGGPPT